MYPAGTLNLLAARKARLRERARLRREAWVAACHRLADPLEKIDAWRDRLRRFGSFAPWGLALLGLWRVAKASPASQTPPRGRWIRWLPVILQGVQLFRKADDGSR